MREIKFRGIFVDTNEFVYGSLILGLTKDSVFEVIFDVTTHTYYKVKAKTVGQFTGLHDSTTWGELTEKERAEWVQIKSNFPSEWNGKEIYEGDLFHCIYYPEGHEDHIYQVYYSEEVTKFFMKKIGSVCVQVAVVQTVSDMSRYERIGNIHQDKQLIDHPKTCG